MFNIKMHTRKEDECGVLQRLEAAGGWPMSTQRTPKFLSCLAVVRYPVTKSLWQESKDTAKNTCQPQRETGEGD